MGRSTEGRTRLSERRRYRSWTAKQKIEIVLAGLRGDRSVKEVCREHDKELCPAAYLEMIDRWGHVSQGPRRYSVTAFLTRAWSQLARDGLLAMRLGPATGLYEHNGSILYWAFPPGPEAHRIRTWADFAADLGLSPYVWTLPATASGTSGRGAADSGTCRRSVTDSRS